jgi:transcriptional regulator with XRE-family HTH domain
MPKRPERPTGFAQRLRALREAAGLTQQQLAERAGLYPFSVAKLEQGVQEPTWPTVLDLARALGVNCLAFVAEGDSPPPPKRGPGRPRKAEAASPGPVPRQGPPAARAGDLPPPQRKPARRKPPRPRGA